MAYSRCLIMKNKPRIRFKGFAEDWEQRKLDELTISIGDGLHGTPKYDENGSYYFINGNNLVDSKVSVTAETKKVAFEALSNDDRRLDSTSILMSINGTIGTLARYNNENIMLGKSVAYITPKNINRDFLFYQLQGNVIQSYFYKNLTGTTIKNLGLGTIKNAIVMSTLSEEESKIGQFFYKLDQFITLHQRKLEKLKLAKKALLQKLFPKNGSQFPEIRFKGFTDAWEQRKLGDTNTFFTDGNYGNDYPTANEMSDLVNGVPFLRGSNLNNGAINLVDVNYITKQKHNLLTSGHTKFDDIIIAVRGSLGNCGYVAKQFIDININSQLAIIRTDKNELSGLFLIEYLLSSLGKKEINRNITGTALKQLPINSLKMINIKYPSINEQEKISILLSKLNSSITLHQRKLDKLQDVKKGLLQKMFV